MKNFQNLSKIIFLLLILSIILSTGLTMTISKTNFLPQKFVIHSQIFINPKIKNEDRKEINDYLEYNEDYSVLMYSPKFLKEILKETDYETIDELKTHIKIIYSTNSHILTLQQISDNKKEGLKLADIILSKFSKQASKVISYNELSIISEPYIVQVFSYSKSIVFISLTIFLLCSLLLFYFLFKRMCKI